MSVAVSQPERGEVVEKVLRRAELARMARVLQNRLALASFKTKHGWENLNLDTIEPKIELELKRKRPDSSGETISDTSSSISERYLPFNAMTSSSPSAAPVFSDDVHQRSGGSEHRKRTFGQTFQHPGSVTKPRKRARSISGNDATFKAPQASWKDLHHLPQSSPLRNRQHPRLPASSGPNLSFASETSTVPFEPSSPPNFDTASDDEDQRLPMNSFQPSSSQMRSSPPRTPPPTRARAQRLRNANISLSTQNNHTGEEGADLLLYLATSPSPANPISKPRVFPPSTPPSTTMALPSSMMMTPSGNTFLGGLGGPNTPSQGFNFADFVNITPSPAQGVWANRTPATAKTPLAAREARRRLNFDALVPPTASPQLAKLSGATTKQTGLGMELGGELVS